METLLALGADPSQESLSIKPLSNAVLVGKEDHVMCLLSHGANPNEISQSGSTALLDAVRCGYPRIVELLLKAGADPFQKGPGGLNAVELAASSGDSNVKDLFRKCKKPPQKAKHVEPITALLNAIESNDKITFEKRLSAIKDVNQVDSRGPTALDLAIRKGNASFVRSLIKAGANPNGVGENRGAPLEEAVRQNRLDLVQILIKAGADPDGAGIEQSPLFAACEEGNAKIADFLIQSGATVNAKTLRGQTPLMFAVVAQSLPVVELLLARGADVNVVDDRGQTALFDAVIRSLYQIKITTISSFGSKARNEKISDDRVEIIKHLFRAGANARQKDKEGRTPHSYCGDAE